MHELVRFMRNLRFFWISAIGLEDLRVWSAG
jgi:hypothetical protein